MAEGLPSLELIAREVRSERDAQFRHTDAVDTKAAIVLGFAGVLVAVGVNDLDAYRLPGLLAALAAAASAALVFKPRRYPTWDLRGLRDEFLRSESAFTELAMLDTHIRMVERQRVQVRHTAALLARSLVALIAAAVLLVGGTLWEYIGG